MQPFKIIVKKHTDGYVAYPRVLNLGGLGQNHNLLLYVDTHPYVVLSNSHPIAPFWRAIVLTAPSCYGI